MSTPKPTFMEPREAARALEAAVAKAGAALAPKGPMTVADAAAASGLALRDASSGLTWLTQEYRGHLRVTEAGELVYLFPTGFTKPWETRDALQRGLATIGKTLAGAARFVVRAWLTVVIFAYVAMFIGVLIALTIAKQGDRDGLPGASLVGGLFRVLADALFWTFHPFSPVAIGYEPRGSAWQRRNAPPKDQTPFYEKVNRFVFGPAAPPEEPNALEQRVVAEIRAQRGRIGLFDVMRVTGLPREIADPMMARLMLDYDGDVDVSEGGGITYRFEALRLTAQAAPPPSPPAAWATPKVLPGLTGNTVGSNILIGLLNGFNLAMATFAMQANLTFARLANIFEMVRSPEEVLPLPYDGVPVVLGAIPLVFSLALFLFPLVRALGRSRQAAAVARENGRLGVLREVLERTRRGLQVTEGALKRAWTAAAGAPPSDRELTRAVVELGGDVDLRDEANELVRVAPGAEAESPVRYRFVDLEAEAEALEAERAAAKDDEAKLGKIAFASDA
ncbi:MAG TPA: hypothetical protein PK141_02070 [Polyangiaceae bacterium]|nr:hypothetical protein [Polyangiaceae bacterium]